MKDTLNKIINWLIIAYAFLLPWQTVYIFDEKFINAAKSQFLTGQVFATELILWLIIILYLISNFQFPISKKILNVKFLNYFQSIDYKKTFVISIWLFLAYSGLSIFWAPDKSAAYYLWFHWLEAGALMLTILASNVSKIKLLWAIFLSAGLQGLLAIQQFLSQMIPADKWLGIAHHSAATLGDIVIETASGRWLRAYGAFSHPNVLAGFLLFGLACGFFLWLDNFQSKNNGASRAKQLLILTVAIIISSGLFFSFSRSAWLALIFILVIFFIRTIKNIRLMLFPLAIILIFAAYFFIFNSLVLARADLSNRLENISQTERVGQVSESWSMIKTAPIFGVGLNNYTYRLSQAQPNAPAYDLQPVHDIFLLILSELGLIGLALFLFFIFNGFNLMKREKTALIFYAPFAAFLIIGFFDHYLASQYAGIMIFWLALTLGLKGDNLVSQE